MSSTHPGKGGKKKPPGQVEHFLPKSRFPKHAYDWDNYFLSCGACNNAKQDKWPAGGYVRPDEGKPEARFVFAKNGRIHWAKGDAAAESTVRDFGLRRYWLTRDRRLAIERYLRAVEKLIDHGIVGLSEILVEARSEYSAAINQNVRRAWKARRKPAS